MASLMTTLVITNKLGTSFFQTKNDLQDRCSVARTETEGIFYCNNPEKVNLEDLADSGKYLTYNGVKSNGQLYTWHLNNTPKTISSVILVYNHNAFPIKVSFTNIGLTCLPDGNDKAAWESYYTGTKSETKEIPAQGYMSMLVQNNISKGYVFGKIARYSITNKNTGAAATAFFYDLAYNLSQNSGNAHAFAASDDPRDEDPSSTKKNSRRRGVGNGFYNYLTIGTASKPVELTDSRRERAATIGGVNAQSTAYPITGDIYDSFNGQDMVIITGGTGDKNNGSLKNNDSGYLYGSYGMQMRVTMTVKNSSNRAREIRIFFGCNPGNDNNFPVFARLDKKFYTINTPVPDGNLRDMITLGTVAAGATQTITFDTVNLAQSAAPFYIGARLV